MALKFKVYQRDLKMKDGSHEKRQVAVQQSSGSMSLRDLANEIADDTSLGVGDVLSVLIHLGMVAQRYMQMGYSIDLGDDLGTITPRITATSLPLSEKYTAEAIKRVNARFTASRTLRSSLMKTKFERVGETTCKAPERDGGDDNPSAPTPEGDGDFI